MDVTLIVTAALLAAAGIPHCAAMCGAACAAAVGSGRPASHLSFHVMRVASYGVAGAVAASSVGWLAQLGQATAAVRPLWTLVHAAALVLGLWLLWQGRQPAWLERLGPKACLLSWLPVVGDPLCAVAGWLRLPFWPCVFYMMVGKFLRYLLMTLALLGVFAEVFPGR